MYYYVHFTIYENEKFSCTAFSSHLQSPFLWSHTLQYVEVFCWALRADESSDSSVLLAPNHFFSRWCNFPLPASELHNYLRLLPRILIPLLDVSCETLWAVFRCLIELGPSAVFALQRVWGIVAISCQLSVQITFHSRIQFDCGI